MCYEAPILPRTTFNISDGAVTYTCDTGYIFTGGGNSMVEDCGCATNWTEFELYFSSGCTRMFFWISYYLLYALHIYFKLIYINVKLGGGGGLSITNVYMYVLINT